MQFNQTDGTLRGLRRRPSAGWLEPLLGFLGANQWYYTLQEFAQTGTWGSKAQYEDHYSFEKLSSYVLEALVRFMGHEKETHNRYTLYSSIRDFARVKDEKHPNRFPRAADLIERAGYVLSARSVDAFTGAWEHETNDEWRQLTCRLLGVIRSIRSAGFLFDIVTDLRQSDDVRTSASIALGELRDIRVAERLASRIREGGPEINSLAFAFSTLRMVPTDWSGTQSFAERILQFGESELTWRLRYSLAVVGDKSVKAALINQLDSKHSMARWSAALGLARMLGPESRHEIEGRLEESDNALERSAIAASLVFAGDVRRIEDLHAQLCETPQLVSLSSVWSAAILSAFKAAPSFEPRAFDLWWAAAGLRTKVQSEYELGASKTPARLDVNSVQGESPMITLLASSQIAGIAGNAVSIIDKIYSQFVKTKTGSEPIPPTTAILNQKEQQRISRINNGQSVQTISYKELAARLNDEDVKYLKAKEKALRSYYDIWVEAYPDIASLSGMERAREQTKLNGVINKMNSELADILDFIEQRFGLSLDDHYEAIRHAARL